ncbi:MAG: N-acetylmuramic acid 6-phosphate etherase [Alistipes sp.]|nr:N-acetylmuramic acid 6-phosphate etherase [Candidatus Alistipes equi]
MSNLNTTEQDSKYSNLDKMSVFEILQGMNMEDRCVPRAMEGALKEVEAVVEALVSRMREGGRVFYLGAGTSGRLGIVDASEIPPTFGVKGKFIGLIAGGDGAIRDAVEGAEDDWEQGWKDILKFSPTQNDSLIGITASGGAPYVRGAVRKAREHGLFTSCITCNQGALIASEVDIPIVTVVGPEFLTGSTRLKAGTCAKLTLNMISTATMIRLGHVRGCKMVDMQLTNQKLVDRGTRMIMEQTGIEDYNMARELLLKYGHVRDAVDMFLATNK